MAVERVAAIGLAIRKVDITLQKLVQQQHWLAALVLLYGWLVIFLQPEFSQSRLITGLVRQTQQILTTSGLGIALGILGIINELLMLGRLYRFVRKGSSDIRPFPERLRK